MYWLDISNNTFAEIPRLPKLAYRREAQIRQRSHGKLIQAGNRWSYNNLVLSRVEGCGNCPEKFIESDENLPLSTYDSFEPETKSWQKSAPTQAFDGPIAILADGHVAKLGKLTEREKNTADTNSPVDKSTLLLELSNADGTHWEMLKLPVPVNFFKSLNETHKLLTPENLEGELGGLLFLGVSTGNDSDLDWWWINLKGTTTDWQHLKLSQTWKSDWQVQNDVYFGQIKLSGHDFSLVISAGGVVALEN